MRHSYPRPLPLCELDSRPNRDRFAINSATYHTALWMRHAVLRRRGDYAMPSVLTLR